MPVSSSKITYFSVKDDDPNTVWVSMGNYSADRVYQTTDGGATWVSISSGLPNIPVMCVIQNKQNTSVVELYAGTDVGVYLKVGAADWQLFSTNLPILVVNELEIYYDANPGNSKLYAGTYGRGMWVSDLYESGVLNPTNFTATASSDTQIDLSWVLSSGNDVMLAYNTTSTFGTPVNGTTYTTTIPGGGTVLYNGSNTTFNHTSLSPNTTYYYKIWSKDGSTTYSTGVTANTSTFCTLITSFPWIEGFEHAGAMPDCWTQQYIDGANPWEMQTSGTNSHPATAHTGTYLARNRATISQAGYVTKFVSPAINLTLVSSPFLTFWHTQEVWEARQDELRVYYKTSLNGAWNLLATYTNSIASWTQETIALPNASSAYFIAFESTVNAGYGVCLDDIEVGVLNPDAFNAEAVSVSQINLNWILNSSGDDVMLAYNTTSTFGTPVNGTNYANGDPIIGGGTVLYNGSNTTFNHTSLSPNTTYYYKIWSKDGSATYSTGVTANTTTFCTLITSFPWIEGFEHAGAMPDCWTQQYIVGANPWEMKTSGVNGHPATAHTGTYLARNRTTTSGAGYMTKFITPTLNLTSVSSPYLSFWHTQELWSPDQDSLRVYYKTSQNGTWNLLATYTSSIASWTQETIALPNASSAYFIAFESTVNGGYGVCLDDIRVGSPVADFTVDGNVSCTGSLTVNFTDNSIGPNGSWAWDIDYNGTTDYTTQNPAHTYSGPGLYSVKLTINNGIADTVKENLILVMNSEPTINTGCTLSSNSNSGNTAGIGIYRFALGSIDYTTSHNDGYYQNYTCSKWTPLELNKSYDITIRTGTANNEGAIVYIDYNDNAVFESGESVVSFPANKDGTRTLSFTTPSSGVTLNKGIRLRVLSKYASIPSTACDIGTYGQAEDYTVYFFNAVTWTGTLTSNWNTGGNWSGGSVPGAINNVIIPDVTNNPVVNEPPSAPAVCNNLTIQSGAVLTIAAGKALSVKGTLSNNAGTSGLVIKSDATGTGSLVENNAVNATAERYITQDKWHYISAPVDDPTANVFLGLYMMKWDEPTETWTYISDPNYSMATDMQGFAIWSASGTTGNKTVTFSGNLNTGAKSIVCTNTAGGPPPVNDGYNFAGNPYPSALDWNVDDGSGWSRTAGNIDMSLYIWNHTAGNYGVYVKDGSSGTNGVDNIIPPHQGFFVHCTSATGSLGVDNGARIHNTKEILKSGEDSGNLLILKAEGNNYYDEIILKTDDLATVLLDPLDGSKMYSSVGAPQFYSLSKDQKELSINAFTESEDYQVIPLGMNAGAACEYSISVKELSGFNTEGQLVLEDLKEGTFTPLFANTSYNFTADPLDEPVRFLLHLNGELDVPENLTGIDHIKVYSFGQQVYISSHSSMNGMVSIYDLPGKEIFNGKLSGETMKKINLAGHSGYLIVRVMTETGNLNQKVFIK